MENKNSLHFDWVSCATSNLDRPSWLCMEDHGVNKMRGTLHKTCLETKKLFWLPWNCANLHPEKFHPSNFTSTKLFLCYNKRMQWAAWVFFSFSFIFGCSLTVFSVHLDASHWNLEFFGFTQTTFFVHPKNSRFQCSASRFTEKTVSSQPKMPEKLKKTSCCSLHCFPAA